MRENSLAKHGVENPMRSPEADRKRAETNLKKYGAENPFARGASTYEKVQGSLVGKRGAHGAANAFARPEVQEKIRDTMRERYGAENPQQVPDIRARTTATSQERYGGVLLSSPVLAGKARETNLARYGEAFPQRTEGVKNKVQETNLARYGVPWTSMNPEVRAKQLEAHHAKWGSHYFASDEGKTHLRSVLVERFGVEFPGAIEGHWEKAVQTFKERYGVEHPLQLAEFLDKRTDTTLAKYGVENVMQDAEVRERGRQTSMENWGAPHPMQNPEYARQHLEKMSPSRGGPNGLERKVMALAPEGSLLFTGDFSFWRWLPALARHKNPDFIAPGTDVTNPKKGVTRVVEAFGDFWHSRMFTGKVPWEHEQELVAAYAEVGIDCLVLWESEVLSAPDEVRARLADFLAPCPL
ncbi:MAG: hypothetical protein EBQ76_00045 [Betaproteobacteria bacterium]|nr:hypothetical protein [Betaproteobacteria bacterium]